MNDLVSIVVPIYNMGSSIEDCVKSLIAQDYNNLEIILVDDGSKDDSLAHCKKLETIDARITVYHTENRGSGPARNYGIQQAKGEYIYFPDADDTLEQNAISTMVVSIKGSGADLVVFGYRSYDVKGKCKLEKTYPNLCFNGDDIRADYADFMGTSRRYGIQGAPWNKLFCLKTIKENHIEYPPLRRHQDDAFIARYMCYVNNVQLIQPILYNHYLNDLSREWDKYPVDYIEAVTGLYQTRQETILGWNPGDIQTHEIIKSEYICNVIKALELSYSPKMRQIAKNRKKWITKQIERTGILGITPNKYTGKYQTTLMRLFTHKQLISAMILMRIKIEAEKHGLIEMIR